MISHHAVLLQVPSTEGFDIGSFLPNKNVRVHRYPSLGIGEVRTLIAEAHRRPEGEETESTLTVVTNFMTEEAQQALLKVVEEPPETTNFVFVVPRDVKLLPTLLSRLHVEVVEQTDENNQVFSEFIDSRLSQRMKLIEKHLRDTDWVLQIKNGIISYTGDNRKKLTTSQMVSLEYVASHLLTRGASNKFLLEHAALVLPA